MSAEHSPPAKYKEDYHQAALDTLLPQWHVALLTHFPQLSTRGNLQGQRLIHQEH